MPATQGLLDPASRPLSPPPFTFPPPLVSRTGYVLYLLGRAGVVLLCTARAEVWTLD